MGADVLLSLSVAVARIEERLEAAEDGEAARRETLRLIVREAVQSALEPIDKRLDVLESDVTKAKTIGAVIAGATAVFAPVLSWLLPKLVPLLPLMLLGCAADLPRPRWPETLRPVSVVANVSDACYAALEEAVASLPVNYLEVFRAPGAIKPLLGEILVVEGPLEGKTVGQSWTELIEGDIVRATIVLEWCHPQIIAHELGHTLGLFDHHPDPENLMYEYAGDRWDLTPEQIERIQ